MAYGILAVKSNKQLDEQKRVQDEAETAKKQDLGVEGGSDGPVGTAHDNANPISQLAAHCRTEWQRARDAKLPIQERMLSAMRQREGKYSDQKLAAIREMGGSEIKMMLTDVKCRAAIAWLRDVLLGTGEKPFSCEPTPLPEMPQEIKDVIGAEAYNEMKMIVGMIPHPREVRERMEAYEDIVRHRAKQQAQKLALRMEDKIEDEYLEGGFYDALDDLIEDFVTFPTAILKGPVIQKKKKLTWNQGQDQLNPNKVEPVVTDSLQRTWYAASPHDIYFSPEARHSEEGTLIERHRLAASTLHGFIGVPGYDEEQIRGALRTYGDAGHKEWLWQDNERAELEGRPYEETLGTGSNIDTLEVWTKVQGRWLKEWGHEGIEDEERWYDACCWLIGEYVIRATINDDPMGERPYHCDSYVPVRNSPWGRGVPELMEDLQNMCDAAARSISNNMGIASGPMVEIETDRLAAGERVTKLHPWRIIQTSSNKMGTASPAVRFNQPQSNVQALMKVFEFFSMLADEYTGIPKYQYGSGEAGGAGSTAAGLSMLMNASSRTMKGVIANVDRIIIGTTVQTHRHIMLYDDEMENKGDVQVVAKASQALLHRESQQMRVQETLAATNNPVDFQIMTPKGRLELLRASLRGLDAVDVDKVLPSDDTVLLSAMAAQGQMAGGGQDQMMTGPEEEQPQEQIQGAQ
jgi:hypothetical protein